jgi:hypothetical protein
LAPARRGRLRRFTMPAELPLATGALTRMSYVTHRLGRLSLRAKSLGRQLNGPLSCSDKIARRSSAYARGSDG